MAAGWWFNNIPENISAARGKGGGFRRMGRWRQQRRPAAWRHTSEFRLWMQGVVLHLALRAINMEIHSGKIPGKRTGVVAARRRARSLPLRQRRVVADHNNKTKPMGMNWSTDASGMGWKWRHRKIPMDIPSDKCRCEFQMGIGVARLGNAAAPVGARLTQFGARKFNQNPHPIPIDMIRIFVVFHGRSKQEKPNAKFLHLERERGTR